jgi:hypothetical protein
MGSDGANAEREALRADLTKRLASKHKERDRWLHLYAQGHISDAELETHLADLRAQLNNLKLLLESVEDELVAQRGHVEIAETAEAWLITLRERVEEIEEDSPDAYQKRRQLVKLLVERIVAGRDESGNTSVRITYRFGPPEPSDEEAVFMDGVESGPAQLALKHSSKRSGGISRIPPIWKALALYTKTSGSPISSRTLSKADATDPESVASTVTENALPSISLPDARDALLAAGHERHRVTLAGEAPGYRRPEPRAYAKNCCHSAIQVMLLSAPVQALPIGNSNSSSDSGYISIE